MSETKSLIDKDFNYGSLNDTSPKQAETKPIPEPSYISSWWSALVFGWVNPLFVLGNSKPQLQPADLSLIPLLPIDTADVVCDNFFSVWEREIKRAREKSTRENKVVNPSLGMTLFIAFSRDFLFAGLLKLVHDLLIFVGPAVLDNLIQFLRDGDAPLSRGLQLTFAVTLSQLFMSFCLRHYFFRCYRVGMRVRTSIVVAVYRKTLRLSQYERQNRASGEITNLISVDAQRLQDLVTYMHACWYTFLQISLALYFLFRQLGPACLGGVLIILIMMPVTKYVAKFMGKMQKRLMAAKDARVEVNNEVLGAMKVIKLQAWEGPFQNRINSLRETELKHLFQYILGNSLSIMLWSAVPLLVALATFACYIWMGNELDVASALTSLALFEILRFPLFMLPQVINRIVEASISLMRIQSFLLAEEQIPVELADSESTDEDSAVAFKGASFVYQGKRPEDARLAPQNDKKNTIPKVTELTEKLSDKEWELMLLRSRLADAEQQIQELRTTDENVDDEHYDPSECDGVAHDLLSLRRINFNIEQGKFIVVVGAVGSGKTSVINSLLGEIHLLSGSLSLQNDAKLAYFSQSPFILCDTVKANILFSHASSDGERPDTKLYDRSISACALQHDFKLLPGADMCEIGERGITLSGGQKARVSMARVMYHDANVFLLDDPLAAVDAHVGRHLFRKCILNELLLNKSQGGKRRTVILVTNALQYLNHPLVDEIIVMREGRIRESGKYADLTEDKSSLFSSFLRSYQESLNPEEAYASEEKGIIEVPSQSSLSNLSDTDSPEVSRILSPRRELGTKEVRRAPSMERRDTEIKSKNATGMSDELLEREVGNVNREVYLSWARAAGGVWVGVFIVGAYLGVEGINVTSRWWLAYWSQHGKDAGGQARFLGIYAMINLASILATFGRLVLVMFCALRASEKIFSRLLDMILRAPMSFFDTTPIGRIVNRFSKDMYTVDEQLIATLRSYLGTVSTVIGVIVVICSVTPKFIFFLIPTIFFYHSQQKYFTKTYRELKRIDSVLRSPLYALVGETLDGVATIRAFSAQSFLVRKIIHMLDAQQNAYFLIYTSQCWLAVRLEFAGTLIIAFACLCVVFEHSTKGGDDAFASLAGLSISFALSVTQSLNWTVRMASDMETNMVAVERIEQYCRIKSEAPRVQTTVDEPLAKGQWPAMGEIEFRDARLRYRPGLPLVLKGLNITIPAMAKIGVVGRTGAGKSTLMVSLLRIVELESGSIFIDGVDIQTVGLTMIRSKIAVIPQDPVLFSGSVRSNLDPFHEHQDEKLYEVLQRVGLYSPATTSSSSTSLNRLKSFPVRSLSDRVFEGGVNFSAGQRQLLAISRALLRQTRIVIIDEATASVDAETDTRIQRVMRSEFRQATCITVAHRLNTIMDSDFILVMDDGRVAEFDTPASLLKRGGMFKDLVDASEEDVVEGH